jgi:hypothetical protein
MYERIGATAIRRATVTFWVVFRLGHALLHALYCTVEHDRGTFSAVISTCEQRLSPNYQFRSIDTRASLTISERARAKVINDTGSNLTIQQPRAQLLSISVVSSKKANPIHDFVSAGGHNFQLANIVSI